MSTNERDRTQGSATDPGAAAGGRHVGRLALRAALRDARRRSAARSPCSSRSWAQRFDVLGLLAFRRSRTTVDPFKPHRASAFVASGVYQVTRNPMYVGLLFLLLGWAVFLGSLWPFLAPVLFVPFVNRFQIKPEEKALARLFGEGYATYTAKVPRWL